MTLQHQPVLLDDTVQVLDPQPGQCYLDATAGFGGHAGAILDRLGLNGRAILIDRDASAVRALTDRFGDLGDRVEILHNSYLVASESLVRDGALVDLILLDLGVSSPQLDQAERGFSFKADSPLDMRMDQSDPLTAAEVVNTYPQRELERIIHDYGEEHHYRAVARDIVAGRPIETTKQLASIVRKIVGRSGDIDGATRTFQALRIEVNSELTQLQSALPQLVKLLVPGGRIAVISFHSLEDRIVKQFFDLESRDCNCPPKQPICTCGHHATLKKLLSKPIAGSINDAINPRARSAKLRAAEKLTPKIKEV
jgi:16S rRNA (cytosine1402-N4)-methyltransferase